MDRVTIHELPSVTWRSPPDRASSRLLPVRGIVGPLRSLPVRERTTILAQVVREGTITRAGADQILIAIVLEHGLSAR